MTEQLTTHTPETALDFVERMALELRKLGVYQNVNAIDAAGFICDGLRRRDTDKKDESEIE